MRSDGQNDLWKTVTVVQVAFQQVQHCSAMSAPHENLHHQSNPNL